MSASARPLSSPRAYRDLASPFLHHSIRNKFAGKFLHNNINSLRATAFSLVAVALLLLSFSVSNAPAQSTGASLSGRVTDQNSAAITGAQVTLRGENRNAVTRSAVTDDSGAFRFEKLGAGTYLLSVTMNNFSTLTRQVPVIGISATDLELVLQPRHIAEEIIVNVNRIAAAPEAVERIPGAVDVLDEETLQTSRVFTATEALRKVTGINARDEEGFGLRPNIGIRGLNPTRSTKVLLLEDGLPLTFAPYGDNASYYHPPIDRFQSVEVLKGSGQILYGPVTVGGVINYITPPPPPRWSGSVTLVGGNRSYFNGHANFGGRIGNTGLLFNFLRKQGEGARENTRSGLNDFNFKSVSTFGERQALTFRFNHFGERSNVTYSGLREDEYRANPRGNIFRNDFFDGDRFGASATHVFVFNSASILTTNIYGSRFSRDWWRQSSNSNQRPNDSSDPNCGGVANLNTTCGNEGRLRNYINFGIEPRLHLTSRFFGTGGETDLGARAHFETQNRQQQNGDFPTARSGRLVEDNERRNKAYSAFIQHRFLFNRFIVTPGLRVEHIRYERTNRLTSTNNIFSTGKTHLTQLIPGLGVSYTPAPNTTLFAGAHRGFAPPRTEDIISASGGTVDLDTELSWNYEIGARTAPFRGLRFEATLFRMDYENQIVPASLAGGAGSLLTNGGETLHQGAEFTGRVDSSALLRSPHNFSFRLAYTFLPVAKFTGTRFSNITDFRATSVSGNRLPYAPEHLLNLNFGYSHSSGFNTVIEGVYIGKQFADDLNTVAPSPDGQHGLVPDHLIWNATLNYTVERLNMTFFFTAKNLFDKLYITDRSRGILPGTPRLAQAGVKFNF